MVPDWLIILGGLAAIGIAIAAVVINSIANGKLQKIICEVRDREEESNCLPRSETILRGTFSDTSMHTSGVIRKPFPGKGFDLFVEGTLGAGANLLVYIIPVDKVTAAVLGSSAALNTSALALPASFNMYPGNNGSLSSLNQILISASPPSAFQIGVKDSAGATNTLKVSLAWKT